MSIKECDYDMCQCCDSKRKILTDWKTVEEIIENEPEIIFDDDQPVVCERRESVDVFQPVLGGLVKKRSFTKKMPAIFSNICNKFTNDAST